MVMPSMGTAGNEPVTISCALSGNFAQIFPYSLMCSRWGVPPRALVLTLMLLLLLNSSSLLESVIVGRVARIASGSRS